MSKIIDRAGQRFGRLTALSISHRAYGQVHWRCVCECGRLLTASVSNLCYGHTRSCGCLAREVLDAHRGRGPDSVRLPEAERRRRRSLRDAKTKQKQRDEAHPLYAKRLLKSALGHAELPPELVQLKCEQIRLRRSLHDLEQAINEATEEA